MDDDIRALASARVEVGALKAELAEVEKVLANSPLVVKRAQLKKRLADMRDSCLELDEQIRTDALKEYEKTGHKHPHPAVSVTQPWEHPWGAAYTENPSVRIKRDLSAYITKEEESA